MIKLEEARKLTNEFTKAQVVERQKKIKEFCDGYISEEIKAKAKQGERTIIVKCEREYRNEILSIVSQEFGAFAVGQEGIQIVW